MKKLLTLATFFIFVCTLSFPVRVFSEGDTGSVDVESIQVVEDEIPEEPKPILSQEEEENSQEEVLFLENTERIDPLPASALQDTISEEVLSEIEYLEPEEPLVEEEEILSEGEIQEEEDVSALDDEEFLEDTPPIETETPLVTQMVLSRPTPRYTFRIGNTVMASEKRNAPTSSSSEKRTSVPPSFVATEEVVRIDGVCTDPYYVVLVYKSIEEYTSDRTSYVYNKAFECTGAFSYDLKDLPPFLEDGVYYIMIGGQGERGTWSPLSDLTEVHVAKGV